MTDTCLTDIELDFADGEYRFWLPIPQVLELERNAGSLLALEYALKNSIGLNESGDPEFSGGGSAEHLAIRETIRLALIGGAKGTVNGEQIEVGPNTAKALVDNYVYPARPIGESAVLAWSILAAAIWGNDHFNTDEKADAA